MYIFSQGESDKAIEGAMGDSKTELGKLLKELDEEVRKAPSPAEFKVTDEFRAILKKISEVRLCVEDHETNDHCYERLVKDSETFARLYRKRNSKILTVMNGKNENG